MKSNIGIYVITSKKTGRQYVGQSSSISTRWQTHLRELRGNKHYNSFLQNHYNKYSLVDLTFEVLELCSAEDLTAKECFWIDHLKCKAPNGFNVMDPKKPGTRFISKTKDHIDKIVESNSQKFLSRHGLITRQQAAQISGVTYDQIKHRIRTGMTIDQAMEYITPVNIKSLVDQTEMNYSTVMKRIKRGYSLEDALKNEV